MQKKILTTIILICLIGIIFFSYIFLKKENQIIEKAVFEAIPTNTAVILEVKDFSQLINLYKSESGIWQELSAIQSIQASNTILQKIDSTLQTNASLQFFATNSITITLQQIGKNKLEYIFYMPLQHDGQHSLAQNLIQSAFSEYSLHSYAFDNKTTIFNLQDPQSNSNKISFAIANNSLIVGESRISVENAIRCIFDKNNVLSIENFNKVRKTAGAKVAGNLYINYHQIPDIASLFSNSSLKQVLSNEAKIASWAEYDITIKQNAILLNGFTSLESSKEYLSIFKKQIPVKLTITSVIPAGSSTIMAMGISNKELFQTNYIQYLKSTNRLQQYTTNIKTINRQFSSDNQDPIDIATIFPSIIDNEIAVVYSSIGNDKLYENTFAVLKVTSQTKALEKILAMLDSYCEKNKKNIESLITTHTVDAQTQYKIYEMPVHNIPEALWGTFFAKTQGSHLTFINNYIVFGNSIQSLQRYINTYELQKTMTNDPAFKKIQDNLLSTYTLYIYSNIAKSLDLYGEFVDEQTNKLIDIHNESLKKFDAFAIQISADNELLYNNIFLNFEAKIQQDRPHTVWESFIDTSITCKPKFIDCHSNETLLLVQDGRNNLYLINNAGKIQWKKQLKEQIISDFYTIDYYKNGKVQYICNTKNYLYIIDRIGNFVDQYPIKLQSEATAGMAIFDYEKRKDYRIFIPGADRKVYLYSIKGQIVKDWAFGLTESEVASPLQHFVTDGKDYIVFSDKFNTYIVNRRGETRVKVKEQFEKSSNNSFTFEPASKQNKARIVTTDISGNIKMIDFDGNVSTKQMTKRTANHFFEYHDFNNDGSADYLFVDKNELEVVGQNTKKLFSYKFDADITLRPIVYRFAANNYKIGIVDNSNSKVYLINNNGALHKGFPLKGKSLFSIGFLYKNAATFNLIIEGEENFLYNYEIK